MPAPKRTPEPRKPVPIDLNKLQNLYRAYFSIHREMLDLNKQLAFEEKAHGIVGGALWGGLIGHWLFQKHRLSMSALCLSYKFVSNYCHPLTDDPWYKCRGAEIKYFRKQNFVFLNMIAEDNSEPLIKNIMFDSIMTVFHDASKTFRCSEKTTTQFYNTQLPAAMIAGAFVNHSLKTKLPGKILGTGLGLFFFARGFTTPSHRTKELEKRGDAYFSQVREQLDMPPNQPIDQNPLKNR